jgi:hypothetical protein
LKKNEAKETYATIESLNKKANKSAVDTLIGNDADKSVRTIATEVLAGASKEDDMYLSKSEASNTYTTIETTTTHVKQSYNNEYDRIRSNFKVLKHEFELYLDEYGEVYESGGERLYDSSNQELFVLIVGNGYSEFANAYMNYEKQIKKALQYDGIPQITTEYVLAREKFYDAKTNLQQIMSNKIHNILLQLQTQVEIKQEQ